MRFLNPCIVLSFLCKTLSDLLRKGLLYGRSALEINFFHDQDDPQILKRLITYFHMMEWKMDYLSHLDINTTVGFSILSIL